MKIGYLIKIENEELEEFKKSSEERLLYSAKRMDLLVSSISIAGIIGCLKLLQYLHENELCVTFLMINIPVGLFVHLIKMLFSSLLILFTSRLIYSSSFIY